MQMTEPRWEVLLGAGWGKKRLRLVLRASHVAPAPCRAFPGAVGPGSAAGSQHFHSSSGTEGVKKAGLHHACGERDDWISALCHLSMAWIRATTLPRSCGKLVSSRWWAQQRPKAPAPVCA
jgi:hypothetical protein